MLTKLYAGRYIHLGFKFLGLYIPLLAHHSTIFSRLSPHATQLSQHSTNSRNPPITMSSAQQIILVTGANQGLGYLTALQLSKRPDVHVLVGARDPAKGAEAVKKIQAESPVGEVSTVTIDITSDESIVAAVHKIEGQFGRLDVLVVRPFSHPRASRGR